MDRRENIKVLLAGTVATGFLLTTGCKDEKGADIAAKGVEGLNYGRTEAEKLVDQKLMSESFFTEKEKKMVTILSDIIIPKDEVSGSATEAGVPDFIEFMMKDYPDFQTPMRGGLMWLENQSLAEFDKSFADLTGEQQLVLVDRIAWPDKAEGENKNGVQFFNLMRNLTCTGFFTTEMGIKDVGYVGNRPNQWDGVPDEVLKKFGLSYDEKTLSQSLRIEDQQKIARWDDKGNLIG